jgi:trehalose 6-phosphate synthase
MVMLAVPSRTEIDEYKKLRVNLERLVNKVNKKFGNDHWKPVSETE